MHEPKEACTQIQAHAITGRSTVRTALRLMDACETHVLAVIESESERGIGIVLRQALERGCLKMGHNPDDCVVAKHTLRDVRGAPAAVVGATARRSASSHYRLLLDDAGKPIVILQYS